MKRATTFLAIVFAGCAGKQEPQSEVPVPQRAVADIDLPEEDDSATSDVVEVRKKADQVEAEAYENLPAPDDGDAYAESTLNLCEPIGDRWEYPTRKQKEEARVLIRRTCKAMGVGREDCKFFLDIVSIRESSYRWWVRHKLAGDVAAALSSYLGNSHYYGWNVRWDHKSRKREDLSEIEFEAYGDNQNPYFLDPERWMFGLGLGGLNISYHLAKFDSMAPPEILCDPVINVMIQVTIARNAVARYKARNFAEIQAIYAGRTYYDRNGRARPLSCTKGCPAEIDEHERKKAHKGDRGILKRCESKGLDCKREPNLGTKLDLRSMTREERYEAAEKIRGRPLPPFDIPGDPEIDTSITEG